MQDEGAPFAGLVTILWSAAAEFVAAVEVADEFGLSPAGDVFAALTAEECEEVEALNR